MMEEDDDVCESEVVADERACFVEDTCCGATMSRADDGADDGSDCGRCSSSSWLPCSSAYCMLSVLVLLVPRSFGRGKRAVPYRLSLIDLRGAGCVFDDDDDDDDDDDEGEVEVGGAMVEDAL